jgi:tRNA(Ile)-lysidine synthase
MPTTLIERVRSTVLQHALFGEGDAIVAAVSGGADSTSLACLLAELAPALGARLVALAHLNHGLRDAADADEVWCADLAARLGLPFVSCRADIRFEASRRGTSIEDAARTVRYAFLGEVAAARGATRIAVGHTRDDQAETVLLRLARGAGPGGLAGIYPRAGQVVRPLLDVRRTDIEAWLRERGIAWREDESNQDRAMLRNAVRHDLMPAFAAVFGPGVVDVLARQADLSRDDADWFAMVATETAARLVLEVEGTLAVEQGALLALHPAVARRLVLDTLRRTSGGRFVGADHVEAVLRLAAEGNGGVDLPGQRVTSSRGRIRFEARPADPGRAGRRRGHPAVRSTGGEVEPAPIGEDAVSNPTGALSGAARSGAGTGPPEAGRRGHVAGGPKCAESVSLEGHAPKGGRG